MMQKKKTIILVSIACVLTLSGITYAIMKKDQEQSTAPQTNTPAPTKDTTGDPHETHGAPELPAAMDIDGADVEKYALPNAKRAAIAYVSYQKLDSESVRKARLKPFVTHDSPALTTKMPTIIQEGTSSQAEALYTDWWQEEDGSLTISVALKIIVTGNGTNKTFYQVYTIPMKQDGTSYLPYDLTFSDEEVVLTE